MRSISRFLPVLAFVALPLTACGSADDVSALADIGPAPGVGADRIADESADPGDVAGVSVDTGDVAGDEPVFVCRELDGDRVCDTFGESDEGPGTYDDSDEGPGTTR